MSIEPTGERRTETPTRGRALVIIPYFGRFGDWFSLYLYSLARQQTLDLLLVTDAPCPPLPPNVRRVDMDLERVARLAASKLGTTVCLSGTRKLCDLKPAYGLVFEEFTRGYEYWAFGDEDVLYGDLDRLLAPYLEGQLDLIVPGRTMTLGHLTLLRNAPRTNELILRDPGYRIVLASDEHWAYDESSWARGPDCMSFTRTVKDAEGRGDVTVHWGLPKRGDVPWPGIAYTYDGQRILTNDRVEIVYYHWGRFRQLGYAFPASATAMSAFGFDRYGFWSPDLGPARQAVRRSAGYGMELTRRLRQRLRRRPRAVRPTAPR